MLSGLAQGFFQAENLLVDYAQFSSSLPTFQAVSAHELEIIISAADNAINYQLNPNSQANGLLDLQVIAAHDVGLGLALAALPQFTSVESLRGTRIGVDVPGSGFALPVAKILREHGLEAGADVTLLAAGASPRRLAGLLAEPPLYEAAIINAESIVRARELGLSVVETVSDVVHPYQGGVVVSSRWWLAQNPELAVRFVRGFFKAMVWLEDPAHRAEAIALLVDGETTPELAAQVYDLNLAADGLAPRALLNPAALRNVLELRDEFGGFESPQDLEFLASPAGGLYNLGYYRKAVHGARYAGLPRHAPKHSNRPCPAPALP